MIFPVKNMQLNSAILVHVLKTIFSLILLITLWSGCDTNLDQHQITEYNWSVEENGILLNGELIEVRGVVYVPGYPGYLPWEIEDNVSLPADLQNSIDIDLQNIVDMGANTVRLWGAPQYCYESIAERGDLYILQTIWINSEQADLHNENFKQNTKNYISSVIDRIYLGFGADDPPVLGYMIGNELNEMSINSTDDLHPDINQFSGNFIITDSTLTASEVFLAEMADYAKSYVTGIYGDSILVSYGNEIRTFEIIDTPFLDFRCHNAYSYAVDYYLPNPIFGSSTGTIFQGWIEYLKSFYPEMPLLISETGLSVAPGAYQVGPPNYGYGGNTEDEQAQGILANLADINSAEVTLAGVVIHEYLDSWWKFGLEDSYTQDPDDVEEWFGIVKLKPADDWYFTEFRPAYLLIKEQWGN